MQWAVNETEATAVCRGTMIFHADGTAAACSEEIEGRRCLGSSISHAGGTTDCVSVLGAGECELCAPQWWGPRDWRHAVHVGRMARASRRCRVHPNHTLVVAARRPTASVYSSTRS